jgi:sterol desaturase/sphingolipid hydroxylase (fatty acid hydroxylase superfamily)
MTAFITEYAWMFVLCAILALALVEELISPKDGDRGGASRVITNFSLYGLSVAVLSLVALALPMLSAGQSALIPSFGFNEWLELPWGAGMCVLFIVDSFIAYWVHRASHRFTLLWRFHAIHHADLEIDVTTGIRHHPLESIPAIAAQFAAALICGATADQVITIALINTLWALVTHASLSRVVIQFPKGLGVLVSPAFHRLHHSAELAQSNSNYANTLALWDWLFNTVSDPNAETVRRVGLEAPTVAHDKLVSQLLFPFRSRSHSHRPSHDRPPPSSPV